LVFCQMYRRTDGLIHAEIRLNTKQGPEMYAVETDEDYATDFMDEIFRTNEIPPLDEWERMNIDEEDTEQEEY